MKNELSPLISIAILNYNGLEYLRETIPPILKLNYPNYEVVLVDNGSTDGSIEFIRKFEKIKLIENKKNLGYSKGKNICVESCKGRYILLLDEDIKVINKNSIQEVYNLFLNSNSKVLSVLLMNKGDKETTYHGGNWGLFGYSIRIKKTLKFFLNSKKEFHLSDSPEGGAIFFERNYFLELGGYNTSQPYYLDAGDFGLRSKNYSGKKTIVTNKIYFIHLGVNRKTDFKSWLWKFQYIPSGNLRILFYNFTLIRSFIQMPFLLLFFFFGSIYKSLKFCSIKPFWVYFISLRSFFINFDEIIKRNLEVSKLVETNKLIFFSKSSRSESEIVKPIKWTNLNAKIFPLKNEFGINYGKIILYFFYTIYLNYFKGYKKILIESGDWPLIFCSIIKKITFKTKLIYRMRGDIVFEINYKLNRTNNLFVKYYYHLILNDLKNVDSVIFCSNWLKKKYQNFNFKNRYVVVNCIDFEQVKREYRIKDIDVLFVTNFDFADKFVPTINFLEKFEKEIEKENLKIVILGDGAGLDSIKNKDYGRNVSFLGRKNSKEFYPRSKVFCHFSNLDAYPLTVIEANYFGIPAVANKSCGMQEQILNDRNGFIFKEYLSEDCFRIILNLIKNSKKNNLIGKNAYSFAINNHNPLVIGGQLEKIIKKC